jgi:Mg-chelatase subunit ChlD
MKVRIKVDDSRVDGRIKINAEDASEIGVRDNEPVVIQGKGGMVAGLAQITDLLERAVAEVDRDIARALSAEKADLDKPSIVIDAEEITFSRERCTDEALFRDTIRDKARKILEGRVITRNQVLTLTEGIEIRPDPESPSGVFRITPSTKMNFRLPPQAAETVLLIDRSGSMSDVVGHGVTKMDAAKRAVREFINWKVSHGRIERIALISFDEEAEIHFRFTRFSKELVENELYKAMNDLYPRGNTDIAYAIEVATDLFNQEGEKGKFWAIILLSDGWRTIGADPIEAAKYARNNGIVIYTIYTGRNENTRHVLREIAEMTRGRYFEETDPDKLVQLYKGFGEGYEIPM